jgi:O-antigen ligase
MKMAVPAAVMATPNNGSFTTSALPTPAPTPLLSLAFYCFWIFNVVSLSRILELKFSTLHIPLILASVALLGSVLGGGAGRPLRSPIGMWMVALTVLYAASVPFSSWRGGSLHEFAAAWLKSALVFLIAGSVIATFRHCRWAMYSVAAGTVLEAIIVLWQGTTSGGRLALAHGSLGNPNEVANGLLAGLPFLGLMFVDSRAGRLRKLFVGAAIVVSLVVLLQTGSRGALIGLIAIGFCVFLRVSLPGKIFMVLAAGVLVAIAGVALPEAVAIRYVRIFSEADATAEDRLNASDAAALGGAVGSTRARKELFLRSLQVTMEHPLVGCGMGQFGSYTAGLDTEAGRHPGWQGTHNSYTQVSSEAGIPALIVYMALLVSCFRAVGACYRRAAPIQTPRARDIANMAFALRTALWAYAISTLFTYVAYSAALPLIAGLIVGFVATAQPELALAESGMAGSGAASAA